MVVCMPGNKTHDKFRLRKQIDRHTYWLLTLSLLSANSPIFRPDFVEGCHYWKVWWFNLSLECLKEHRGPTGFLHLFNDCTIIK